MTYIKERNRVGNMALDTSLANETQLVELIADIPAELGKGNEVEVCMLDFSKAFHRVNHNKLIEKLHNIGVCNHVANWIASLRDRTQRVVLECTPSDSWKASSGVSQGSVIGPDLFLVYINNLLRATELGVCLFADDTIVHTTTSNLSQLQSRLQRLELWETAQYKCSFMPPNVRPSDSVGRENHPPLTAIYLHNKAIPQVMNIKYLGVKIQDDLKWNSHIKYITAEASSILGVIKELYHLNQPP